MGDPVTQVSEYLDYLFAYGPFIVYLAIFLSCLIENLFPPFPGDSVILVAGGLVATGRLDLVLSMLLILSGGMSSVMVLYLLGRNRGRDYFIRKNFKYFPAADIYRMENAFRRWGAMILIFSRFVVGARTALALVAGMSRYPTNRMVLFSLVSYLLFCSMLMYIGIVLVENLDRITYYVRTYNTVVWPILALLVLWWVVWKVRQSRKGKVQ
ncbi:MAG: DedA family protein [Candidatus Zixiibacteriota bacterium]|nr:MAG: DedA family protein [candidate division Zixibacteria bacterium]